MIPEALARALDRLVDEAPATNRHEATDLRWAFETFVARDAALPDERMGAQLLIRDSVTGLLGAQLVPLVIAPLFELAETPLSNPRWVAMRIPTALRTASAWKRGEPDRRALGLEIERRVQAQGERALAWIAGRLEDPAILIARRLPALERSLVDRLAALPSTPTWGLLALAALPPIPQIAFERASEALDDPDEERRVAGAILLQRHPALDEALAARIDDVLGPSPSSRWGSLCRMLDCEILPLGAARFRGEMEEAEVIFVGERSTTVRRAEGGVSTLPVVLPDVMTGARVKVGLSPQGVVRVIEHGETRIALDLRGQRIATRE